MTSLRKYQIGPGVECPDKQHFALHTEEKYITRNEHSDFTEKNRFYFNIPCTHSIIAIQNHIYNIKKGKPTKMRIMKKKFNCGT